MENVKATDIVLDDDDMARLSTIDKGLKFIDVREPSHDIHNNTFSIIIYNIITQAHIFFTKDYTMEELWDYKEDEQYIVKK